MNSRFFRLFLFAFLSALFSFGLITAVDDAAAVLLRGFAPALEVIAWIRLPSLTLAFTLFLLLGNRDSFRKPLFSKFLLKLYLFWLIPSAILVFTERVWIVPLPRIIDVIAFLITGLLAEEFLFRGVLFDLAARVKNSRVIGQLSFPVLSTSLFFSLSHLQYHNFQLTPAAISQIVVTFFMGIFFALARESSASIWGSVLFHVINNSFTVLRNLY